MSNKTDVSSLGKEKFIQELKNELPKLKCNNVNCEKGLTQTKMMYDITYLGNQPVTFKVNDTTVCCSDFKTELQKEVEAIYQKYR